MKHLLYTLFFVLSLSHLHLNAQNEFYNVFSSTTSLGISAYTVDSEGNYILCGTFQGTIDLDPGVATSNATSAGLQDIYLVKLNPQGQFLWGKTYGATSQDFAEDVIVDADNHIWLCGSFQRNVDFNPGGEDGMIMNSNGTTGGNQGNGFVLKLNPEGEFQKIYHLKNVAAGFKNSVDFLSWDPQGNLNLAGSFNGRLDADPGSSTFILSNPNPNSTLSRPFFIRLDPVADTLIWAKHIQGEGAFRTLNGISCDSDGNVFGVGGFRADLILNPEVDSLNILGSSDNLFILKLNNEGEFVWVKTVETEGVPQASFAINDDSGDLYVLGRFNSTIDFNNGIQPPLIIQTNGENDIFLVKMNGNGQYIWARTWGNETNTDGLRGLNRGADGRILLTLTFTESVDANPGPEELMLTSSGGTDFYIVSIDTDGQFIDVLHRGGTGNDFALKVMYNQGVYTISGSTNTTFQLNPPLPASEISVSSGSASYLARFTPADGSTNTLDLHTTEIKVFPNPAKDFIQVKSETPLDFVEMYDLQGRKLLSIMKPQENIIPLNHLESGIYFVRCQIQNDSFINKIIIH